MTSPAEPEPAKMPAGEAIDLKALVEYGDGAIVSRTLVENDSGSLTLFAFDAGQRLSEHTAPFDAFVHVVDGEAKLTIGGQSVSASEGQVVLMPANVPHAVEARRRFKMLLHMLRASRPLRVSRPSS